MERRLGEIFKYNGEWYQCIRSITCTNCGFNNKGCLADKHITGDCSGRLDGASVIFKKLEKVGDPFVGRLPIQFQKYRTYMEPIIKDEVLYREEEDVITIEIKQNQEDMEKKKFFYDGKMDKECIAICDALNSLDGVKTTGSCCGHCKDRFMIFFNCIDAYSLSVIARSFDKRYSGTHMEWKIETITNDNGGYSYFLHSVEKYDGLQNMHEDISQLVENIKLWSSEKYKKYFNDGVNEITVDKQELLMKPFDLEEAKQGKRICTRNGRIARIICFDANNERPIVALVEYTDNRGYHVEEPEIFYRDGKIYKESETIHDLMMLP